MKKIIPYSRQHITASDVKAVVKALNAPFLTQGPAVAEFEHTLSRYCKARYAVAFSSGTAALHGAYVAAGFTEGDEVITSPLTFAATANMLLALGAKPIFADIDIRSGNLDPADVARKITAKTKGIIAVDYAGLPADISALREHAKKHNLIFIEDSAQGLGAQYKRKPVGGLADMTMFSFHPVKTITTGEGGAILTNDRAYYEKLLAFRSHGLVKDKARFVHKNFSAWHQEVQSLGFNYRLPDILAALGTSQMQRIDSMIKKRTAAARRYDALLEHVPGVITPARERGKESAWHLYVIRIDSKHPGARDRVFDYLRARGLSVQVHYLPVYWHPYYEQFGYKKGMCPRAEAFCMSCISIPLFPSITRKEQQYVVDTLREALAKVR